MSCLDMGGFHRGAEVTLSMWLLDVAVGAAVCGWMWVDVAVGVSVLVGLTVGVSMWMCV